MQKNHLLTRVLALTLAVLLVFSMLPTAARAEEATSYTYMWDEEDGWFRTQDAYLPERTVTELGLKDPSDLYIDEQNMLYIADTGNRRIIQYDIRKGTVAAVVESPEFSSPSGIYVTETGLLYVADPGAKKVLVFDQKLELIRSFGKPTAPIFSDTNFEPKKIAVDGGGSMYIISEGVYNGVIQLAHTGEFLGYFAVNEANLTFGERLQRLLFTRAQLANLVDANPAVFTNVFVDRDGVVYTATSGLSFNGMKKHSTDGGNMFKNDVWSNNQLTDVYVDPNGLIYTCGSEGYIEVCSRTGELIFEFGSFNTTTDVVGLFTRLVSVAVDMDGRIWGLDGNKGYLQSFKPTEYANTVYNAMNLYEAGHYEQAMAEWNEVLTLNQMSTLAHNGVGKAYLHAQEYELALEHFEVANNKAEYSEAFWEVRNEWLQHNLSWIIMTVIGLFILWKLIRLLDREGRIYDLQDAISDRLNRTPIIKDIIYAGKTCRHPMDCYYEIRKDRQGSVTTATLIYLVFFIVFMAYQTVKGFIYQEVSVEDMDIGAIVLGFFLLLGLFIICNYLDTSIHDGNGSFKQIYMVPAYGLLPLIGALVAVTVISYGLTYNESFLLTVILMVGIVWSAVLIFVGLQTIHEYEFGETVRSLLMTVVFMVIAAVIGIILSIMWDSLYRFIISVGKELIQNAS